MRNLRSATRGSPCGRTLDPSGTPVECASAAVRLRRQEVLTVRGEERVLEILGALRASWVEVLPSEEVRDHAVRLLRVHALKAAAAGSALTAVSAACSPAGRPVVATPVPSHAVAT